MVFGTNDSAHPGVQKVMAQPELNIAGAVTVLSEGLLSKGFSGDLSAAR